jgi:hypothetical protein
MILISGDLPVLRFLEKTPRFFFYKKNGLNIGWPTHFKIFRKKTPRFFLKNGLNIGWPARCELQKKSSYLEE